MFAVGKTEQTNISIFGTAFLHSFINAGVKKKTKIASMLRIRKHT